jgi:Domain of unknown function DUF11/MBG domain (YGX type)/Ubiquitin-activating enzyme E1 FCCH domain/Lactonase, 7-bladed beta-propeller
VQALNFKENSVTFPTLPGTSGRLSYARIRSLAIALLLIVLAIALPSTANAQSFVYVNNQGVDNSVVAFSVSSNGSLSEITGSPYSTGGAGATASCYGADRIVVSAAGNLLFVSNGGDQTISVFSINPATGALTLGPGSPFASGLTLDACNAISLAATPDGKYLMASSNGQVKTFNVAANGVLTPAASTTNCCSPNIGMKISSNGQLLALSNENSVSMYIINADGSLTAAAGSPFPRTGTGLISGLDFSCAADRLYGSEVSFGNSVILDAWTVDPAGVLTPVAKSPFTAAGTDASTIAMSADNSFVFVNNQLSTKLNSFSLNADGSLTSVGSFGGVGTVHVPGGLAVDASGNFLFVADDTFGVASYRISATGGLSSAGDVAINRVGTIQGLAAYPPKSCASADFALSMTASPSSVEAGSNVTYTITITNNGPSASSATVVDNLPNGASFVSCVATGGGVCSNTLPNPHTVRFASLASGETETVTLVAQTSAHLLNGSSLSNTATLGNQSAVDSNPANNSATATVAITATPSPTTLTVSPATGSYGGLAILTATLRKSTNSATVAGELVSFSLNGTPVGTSVTNGVGQAILTINVAGVPLGSYPGAISASFAGDALFGASSGSSSLTVNKAVLSVIAGSAARLYGDLNPVFTYAISGFLNGDTAALVSGTTTCTNSSDQFTAVGRYPITCDLGTLSAANYTFTLVPGTLIINPAPLTVTADDKTRIYGDPNPVFTGSVTGLKNADALTPTYSTVATAAASVGTYPIVPFIPASAISTNYAITYINGTLTVTPAALTVNIDSATRVYGDPNPVFTGTILGIKNNETITAAYSTTATAASPIGSYPITATLSGLTLTDYSVTINNGTLTITPAPLTVTAANASRLYGDPNPPFTGTIVGIKNSDSITATYSTPASPASPVGAYPIVPSLVDPSNKLSNYTVTVINGVLTINPATLTVTITNAARVYGDSNPTFSGTISGLKNEDNITATYTSAGPTASVGTYPITPVFSDPASKLSNYTVQIVGGILTITKAPLSVVAPKTTRIYGDPNPLPTITGIKNGDNITATYTTPTSSSPVGNYTLVPVLVDPTNKLGNYTVTTTNGSLTINQAQFAITAASFSRPYGSPNPTFTGTFSGSNTVTPITTILANDGISYSFSSTATQTSNAGTYAITITASDPNSKLSNYRVTQINGTLTVTQGSLTVTMANQTLILGTSTWACSTVTPPASATPSCVSYSGFVKNGVVNDGPANLGGSVSCALSNGTGNVGTFTNGIACAGLTSPNYAFTFVKGTYNVQYEPAGTNCTNGPGHVILDPINTAGTSVFNGATVTITGATNAQPIVIAASNHGFVTGQSVTISGVQGNTAANGTFVITVVDANHFRLNGSRGNANYTGGGTAKISSIPVQFRVCGTNLGSVSSAGVVSSFVLTTVNGVSSSTPAPLGGPFTFVGGTLAGAAGSSGWQFNLSTSNLTAGNTYAYRINLNDGTNITFQFRLQ